MRLILIPILISSALLWACGPAAPEPEQSAPAEARAPRPDFEPVHRGADVQPPLVVLWDDEPAAAAPRARLGVVVRSFADAPVTAQVAVTAVGLDDREVSLSLGRLTVPARGEQRLTVRTGELPLQSTTHSLELVATARFEHDGDVMTVQSTAIGYHFERGFGRAVVYSLDEMASALGGGVIDRGRPAEVRALEGGAARLLPASGDGAPRIRFSGRSTARAAVGSTASGLIDASGTASLIDPLFCQKYPWDCCSGANCVDVCADWKTAYVDASTNYEDYGKAVSGSIYQTVDASYAHFQLEECAGATCAATETTVADKYFGPDGCALVNLTAGKLHRLSVSTEHRRQGVDVITNYYSANNYGSLVGIIELQRTFTAQSKSVQDVYPNTLPYHAVANAAAAVSRVLTIGAPGGDVTVNAGVACNGGVASGGIPATDACAGGSSLNTGPNQKPDGAPGMLRWKFVLTHEIGHVYQSLADALPSHPYCFSQGYNPEPSPCGFADPTQAVSPLCRCDHVTLANRLHCMQSLERDSTAQVEGFAQYFSARAWNNPADADCHFKYYKEFNAFLLFGTAVVQPPVHLDCREQVRWRDAFCFSSGFSTEYDWMNFLWNVGHVGANTTSLTDLLAIMSLAKQTSATVSWTQLAAAASTYYGAGSAKYAKFIADADKFGVDNDQY